jgi:hypothetical protein
MCNSANVGIGINRRNWWMPTDSTGTIPDADTEIAYIYPTLRHPTVCPRPVFDVYRHSHIDLFIAELD